MSEALVTDANDAGSGEPVVVEETGIPVAVERSTPGTVLRLAREARGQSIADVVQVIRFSAHQIEALERDDYASLPGATSVRGLVRNYARFLKLDATPLLAKLEPAVPLPEVDVRPPANMGEAERSSFVERIPPWFIAAGLVLVLLVLAAYVYSSLPDDGESAGIWRSVTGSPPAALSSPVAPPAVVTVVAPAPAVVPENDPAVANATPGPPPFAGLRIEFDDRSWIEIRDATQKVVFVGEYPAGTRQNVAGRAPFQIWIGKASGVRVFMGERSIDLKPHVREDVARFVLE
jgi:cytoskeleton protein RodZ